jgi:hypothetical protein
MMGLKMKTKSTLIRTLLALCLVIFAGLVFLPAILSSDILKPRILQEVNQHLPGQLRVSEWKFKWFSGIEAKGIIYDHRQENLLVEVAELKGYRGLVHLIADPGNLGAIELLKPDVLFYLSDKKRPETPKQDEPSTAGALPAFAGILKITDGSIRTVNAGRDPKPVVKDLDLYLNISDLKEPIRYRLFMTSGDTTGRFSGEGAVTLSPDDPLNLSAIQSDAKLKITNWEIEDALAILASRGDYPAGKGRLNTDLTLRGSASENLDIKGQASLNRLQLWGGPLGVDRPAVNKIDMQLDGAITQGTLSLKQLRFQSSLANGSATGSFSNQGQKRLKGTADINLAEIFTQLPQTLKLREETKLSQGKLVLSADVKSADGVTTFDSTARIDQLRGVSKGKKLSWNKPISVIARGERRAQGIRLDNLSLRSSFLNADGQGDLSNMRVTLSADLAAALKELKKFLDIKEWDGSGKLFAKLQVQEASAGISTAALNLDTRNLALSRNGRPILPKQNVKADLSTAIRKSEDLSTSEFRELNLTMQSSMATGKFSATRFKLNPTQKIPDADNLLIDGRFDLKQITALLQNFDKLSRNTRLAGTSHIQGSGSLEGQALVLKSARLDTQNFRYRSGSKTLQEERLTIKTKGKVNFNTKSLFLAPIEINGAPGNITIPELTVNDWSNLQKEMKTRATANLDLAKLTTAYGDFIQLPEKTRISGKGTFDLDMDFSSPKAQFLKVAADLSPFQLTSETLPLISEDHVKLKADLKRSPDGKALTIENIQLNSTPLSLSAAGNLDQAGNTKTLDANGNINLDLKMLSPYLQKIAGPQITITGKGDNPFKLKMVSGETHWTDALKQTDFTGAIRADSIDAFGVGISATEVPLRITNESAVAKLAATANGGQLNLQPRIDLRKEPYLLSLPPDSTILKDVEITDAMAEGLMSKIHPVFQGSVQAEGHVDLYMQHFSWPLDKKDRDKAAFAGTLRLKGVRINSTNLLSGLLDLVGVRGNEMDFGDLDIDFVARNGRIETSPIRLEIDGYPIELRGSVGFDKSLDYTAKLPITPKLVGKKAYRYLEGVTIDVPIRGNSSTPDIDESTMQKATASLAEQALQKSLEKGVQNIFEQIIKKK